MDMNLDFHTYESFVPEEQSVCMLVPADKVAAFSALCKARLPMTTDERQLIQTVICAALETEHLVFKDPDILVEAVIRNPHKRAEILCFAESILAENIQ